MHSRTCALCGGTLHSSHDPVSVEVRGETVSVAGVAHLRCNQCGEEYLDPAGIRTLQREAARQVRAERGLLQPEEITAIREALGLSKASFERLLGVGEKTAIRWEKGTVFQSATADLLMRLIRDVPAVLPALQGARAQFQVTVSTPKKASHGWRAPRDVASSDLEVVRHDRAALAA